MAYPVTVEALHTVFSPYGFVQKIAIFEKNGQHQVKILILPHLCWGRSYIALSLSSDQSGSESLYLAKLCTTCIALSGFLQNDRCSVCPVLQLSSSFHSTGRGKEDG